MRDCRWSIFLAALAVVTGCGKEIVADAKVKASPKLTGPSAISTAIQGYSTWKAAKADFFKVDPQVWILCVSPSKEQQAILDAAHTGFIRVFVNAIGEKAMFARADFPEGTIIVKERHATKTSGVEFCTVMRKREEGYNPQCGDWEFSVLNEKNVATDVGRLETCMGCHAEQKKLDHTFRSYLDRKEGLPIAAWALEHRK